MVFIDIEENKDNIVLNCHKHSENGEMFRLVIDRNTLELIEKPPYPDIDLSTAYSHVYQLLKKGIKLPEKTVAEWG